MEQPDGKCTRNTLVFHVGQIFLYRANHCEILEGSISIVLLAPAVVGGDSEALSILVRRSVHKGVGGGCAQFGGLIGSRAGVCITVGIPILWSGGETCR